MADDHSAQPEQPATIGPYTIEGTLGTGGMAAVYRAVQPSLDREVAIKVLPEGVASQSDAIARFERESTLVSKLSHPGIIQIFDRGVDGERYYIVMEYIRGCSLEDLIRDGTLSIPEIVDIALQVAKGLAYAHSKGVVHRDIKPGNILVSSDSGVAKIADFGIAQFAEAQLAGDTLTRENTGMGTLNYMAPEQRLDARNVDGRADIFAFGVIVYEMLTRRLPMGHFKAPDELRDDTPPKLSAIVMRCLQQSPSDRYESFDAVVGELEKVTVLTLQYRETLAKMASTVRRMSGKTTTRLFKSAGGMMRSWPWRLVLAGVGAIVVAALLVVSVRVIISSRGDGDTVHDATGTSVVSDDNPFAARFAAAADMRGRGDYGQALTTLRAIRTEAKDAGDERAWGEAQWQVAEIHREVGNSTSGALAYGYFFNTFREIEAFAGSPRIPESLYWAAYFKETQEREDYPTAIALYGRLISEYPENEHIGSALFRAAYLMDEKQRPPRGVDDAAYYGRAAHYYRTLIDEHPDGEDREQALYRLGQMYEDHKQIRDYERAVSTYEEMAEAYPESSYDPLFLAAKVADRELDDEPRAIRLYEAFLHARPSSEHADDARSRLRRLR